MVWWSLVFAIQLLGTGQFGDGISTYDLLILHSSNSNGSFCPGTVALNCSSQEAFIILDWFINKTVVAQYIFESSQTFPRNVIESPVNVTIVNATNLNNAIEIDITSTLEGSFSYLNGATVQCGRDTRLSDGIVVRGHVPDTPNVTVKRPLFLKSEIKISAEWQNMTSPCKEIAYVYEALLRNLNGSVVQNKIVECSMELCSVDFLVPQLNSLYTVEVTTLNTVQDRRSESFTSDTINATAMEVTQQQLSVNFSSCFTSVICQGILQGTCNITFRDNIKFKLLVSGTINSSISLPQFLANVNYTYMAVFNSMYLLQGEFTGVQYSARLSHANTALIVIGVLICVLSSSLLIIETAIICYKGMHSLNKKIVILIMTTVVLLIIVSTDIILWIIFASVVSSEEDTCDEVWQKSRDDLVIAAFVFAVISVFPSILFLLVFKFYEIENIGKNGSEKRTNRDAFIKTHNLEDISDVKIDEKGMTTFEQNVGTAGHRERGESTTHAALRIKEEISNVVIEELKNKEEQLQQQIDGQTYDTLDRSMGTPQQPKSTPPDIQTYSTLDKIKPEKNNVVSENSNEYSDLQHKTGAQGPAFTPHSREVLVRQQNIADGNGQYEQLDLSQQGNNQVTNLNSKGEIESSSLRLNTQRKK